MDFNFLQFDMCLEKSLNVLGNKRNKLLPHDIAVHSSEILIQLHSRREDPNYSLSELKAVDVIRCGIQIKIEMREDEVKEYLRYYFIITKTYLINDF